MSPHRFHATRIELGPEGLDVAGPTDLGEAAGFRCTALCGDCGGTGGCSCGYCSRAGVQAPCPFCGGTGEVEVKDDCDCAHGCANPGPDCPGHGG